MQQSMKPVPWPGPLSGPCAPQGRRSIRVALTAQIVLRRPGQPNYHVGIHDLSIHGCKIDFVQRPRLHDRIWIKLDGIEPIEADVCWVEGFVGGVEFRRPLHPAVFDLLVGRLA